jgi:hypothetical protein
MTRWAVLGMLTVLLALPMLACGFPLPAGTEMMQLSEAACAEGETLDSCQMRQDAYQLMGKLRSAVVPDLNMRMFLRGGDQRTEIAARGSFEYLVLPSRQGMGANLSAVLEEAWIADMTATDTVENVLIRTVGDRIYASEDDGATWHYQSLKSEDLLSLSILLGLVHTTGISLDLFSEPELFSVTSGGTTSIDGQTMHVQTLTFDLPGLLTYPDLIDTLVTTNYDALAVLLEYGGSEWEDMSPEDLSLMLGIVLLLIEDSDLRTTLYIGADDGYIHYFEERLEFLLVDESDPAAGTATFEYTLSGHVTQHNAALVVEAPPGAILGGGFFGSDFFGGGGPALGDTLFGE